MPTPTSAAIETNIPAVEGGRRGAGAPARPEVIIG